MKRIIQYLVLMATLLLPSMEAQAERRIEYFWDSDPGVGQGMTLSAIGSRESEINTEIDVSSLSDGLHRLGLRALNGDYYSSTCYRQFYVHRVPQTVKSVEYFWDNDPGVGKGTTLPTSIKDTSDEGATTFIDVTQDLSVAGLSEGLHRLGLRALNGDYYSSTCYRQFYVLPVSHAVEAVEYWLDTDPGVGKGTKLDLATAEGSAELTFDIPVEGLADGVHLVGLRVLTDGTWSETKVRRFYKRDVHDNEIARIEYFWDKDPGRGNGTPLDISPSGEIDFEGYVDVQNMSGTHTMYMRAQSGDGEWSAIYAVGEIEITEPEPTFVIEPNDFLALRNLYERFDGPNWRTRWNVEKERYEAEDYSGVVFAEGDDGYQHVREIALPNNGLSGNVTEWRLYFPQLTYLNLSGNALRGDVTGFVRELKALKTLDISGNQIYEIHSLPASVTTLYKGGQFSRGSGYQSMEGLTPVRVYISNEQRPVLPTIFTYDLKLGEQLPQTVYMEEKDVYSTKLTNYYASLSPLDDPSTSSGQAQGYYATAWRYSPYTYAYEQEHAMLLRSADGSVYPAVLCYAEGDANMSGYTNVLDVQTTLNAILNPSLNVLFNRSAANTFDDALINVQDVVCTVNIVLASDDFGVSESQRRLGGADGPWRAARETSNVLFVADDRVCLSTDEDVASLSIELEGVSTDEVGLLLNRNNFQIKGSNTATGSRYVIFSLNGTTIPAGETSILRLSTYGAQPLAATLASAEAEEIPVSLRLPSPTEVEAAATEPLDGETSIYTLDGRKTTTPTHGVFITTDGKTMGRKVLKK